MYSHCGFVLSLAMYWQLLSAVISNLHEYIFFDWSWHHGSTIMTWCYINFVVSFHLALYGGYEGWWLPGGCSSVVKKTGSLGTLGSLPYDCILFIFYSIPFHSIPLHSWWVLPFHIPFVIPLPLNVCLIPVRIKRKRWIQIHQKHREIKLKTMQWNLSLSPLQTTLHV